MKEKRYRAVYGKTHEDTCIADDVERQYLLTDQVDRLNEYDEKCEVMEAKLKELNYELVFICETWNYDKGFESKIVKKPSANDKGEWMVITVEEYEKFKDKQSKLF